MNTDKTLAHQEDIHNLQVMIKDLGHELQTLRAVHSQRITDLLNKYNALYDKCSSDFSALYKRVGDLEQFKKEAQPIVNESRICDDSTGGY